jgi:pimeloyl-ACP methyl ester carboxylesterase
MAMMSQSTLTTTTDPTIAGIGGTIHTYLWTWQGQPYAIAYETLGTGIPVLLLPAFSTVSTRSEMRGVAERLAPQFQVVALDWLGFGQSARSNLNYQPTLYHQLLKDFVQATFDQPIIRSLSSARAGGSDLARTLANHGGNSPACQQRPTAGAIAAARSTAL